MTNLIFTSEQYTRLQAHLFPGDGLEALAVCIATQIDHPNGCRFLVNEVFEIPHSKCQRDADLLTWSTRDIVDILDKAARENKSIIKVHSHPFGPRAFSRQDDRSDAGLFPSIHSWCETSVQHCSVVFTPDFAVGRTVNSLGSFRMIDNIWIVGHPLRLFPYRADEIVKGFDESTYEVFRGLRVGVVGCSGTGGWIAELLGRNEVGGLALCDHDFLENKNLNRVPNAKLRLCGLRKVVIAAEAVRDMGLGTVVEISETALHTEQSIRLLKSYDVVFGCVDSVFARHVLNTMCSYYMIPLFDIGVHIASGKGKISAAVSGFEYIVPGGSSLQTRGIYTAQDLATETYHLRSPKHFNRLKEDGYVRGQVVGRPAVAATNCLGAAWCFEEFQARVLGYRTEQNEPLASKVFCAKSGEIYSKQESDFEVDQVLLRKVGLGDVFFEKEKHLLFGETTSSKSDLGESQL